MLNTNFTTFKTAITILLFGTITSCVEDYGLEPSLDAYALSSKAAQNCDTSFPNLGPSATRSKTCSDVSNPVNKGTLDCRTTSYGGYSNSDDWGSYKIQGSSKRYDGTETRVERFFNNLNRGKNKKTVLSGYIRIVDLSDKQTCVMQSHAGGKIVAGEEKGNDNRSAQFLVYVTKKGSNEARIETHRTSNPYTTTTGGSRDVKFFRNLNLRENYPFRYETGYDSNSRAYSKLKIGSVEKTFTHSHTTERVYTRYGAYGASDNGDRTAHIKFKNINLCR